MQIANLTLAIAGDKGNTVPLFGVTAAEVAVLQAIHGNESVYDVSVIDDVATTNRQELERLKVKYATAHDGSGRQIINLVYPGAAAQVFENFADLGLPEEFYAAQGRAVPTRPAVEAAPQKKAAKPKKATEPAVVEEEDDGIRDIPGFLA